MKGLHVLNAMRHQLRSRTAPTWVLEISHKDLDSSVHAASHYVKIDMEGPEAEFFEMEEEGGRNGSRSTPGPVQSPVLTRRRCTQGDDDDMGGIVLQESSDGTTTEVDRNDEGNDPVILPVSMGGEEDSAAHHVTKSDVDEMRRLGLEVLDDNEPLPENVPNDVAAETDEAVTEVIDGDEETTTTTTKLVKFNNVDQWRVRGHDVRQKPKMIGMSWERMESMSIMYWFLLFFPIGYIKEVVITETNKKLSHKMTYGEFLRFLGCWLIMSCYEGILRSRDWWSLKTISMHEGAPFRLHEWMSRKRFEVILGNLVYTNYAVSSIHDPYFLRQQMEMEWNNHMTTVFEPSWVSVLDESMQVWFNQWSCPGWMYVERKTQPFGNELHTIACCQSGILFHAEMMEGKIVHKHLERNSTKS